MRLSVIIPTRSRPDMCLHALESLWSSTQGYDIETVVVVDNDGVTVDRLMAEKRISILIFNEDRLGSVASWNKGLRYATGNLLLSGSDDIEFRPDWLEYTLKAHQDGYGFVAINSLIHDLHVRSGVQFFDRQFCKDHLGGVMYTPYYRGLFADNEMDERAKRSGRFFPCYEAVVVHNHPCENRRPIDANDTYRDRLWPYDEAVYRVREAAGFPDDFEAVI